MSTTAGDQSFIHALFQIWPPRVWRGHLPQLKCCFCLALQASRCRQAPRCLPRFPSLLESSDRMSAATVCAYSTVWPCSADTVDAAQGSAAVPFPAAPWPCYRNGSRSRCDAVGRVQFDGVNAPSPRYAAAWQNPPSSMIVFSKRRGSNFGAPDTSNF